MKLNLAEYPRLGEKVFWQKLPSGLTAAVVSKPLHAKSCAFLAVRCGSMDTRFPSGERWTKVPAGTAHYLEHKLYDTPEGSALQAFAQNGAADNAFTDRAMTAYYVNCTDRFYENLGVLLRYVSEPYFTQESVERERGIIAQEIQEAEDDPDERAYLNLMDCLYWENPVRVPVLGSAQSIRRITPQILYGFHKAFYTPSNMVLVCVGSMDPERVLEEAESALTGTAAVLTGGAPAVPYGREGPMPHRREARAIMEVSMPQFLAGYKCPPTPKGEERLRRSIIGDLACDVLFGESSPLYARLYAQGAINGSLGGGFDQFPGAEYLCVGGDTKDPWRVFEEITAQARRLGEEGIDKAFYEQLRRAAYGQMIRSLNSFANIVEALAEGYFEGYDYFRFPEIFDSVQKSDVEAFLRENIIEDRAAVSLIEPGAGTEE